MSSQEVPALQLPRLRPWREITILALILMELSWIVPWFRSLTPATYATSALRAFVVLAGLVLMTHMAVRLMNYLYLRVDLRRVVLAAIFIVAVLVSLKTLLYLGQAVTIMDLINRPLDAFSDWTELIPNEFVIILTTLFVCWRGLALAQTYIEPNTVRKDFQTGIFMFLAFIFINTLVTGETPGRLLYVFFAAGLIAMSAARISVIGTLRGGSVNPFDRRWFFGMVTAMLFVVGLAAFVSGLMSTGGIANVGSIFLGLFALIMVAILSPLIFVLQYFFSNVSGVSDFAQEVTRGLVEIRSTFSDVAGRLFEFLDRSGIFGWVPIIKPVLLWSIVIVIGLLILVGLSRWLLKERQERIEERESLVVKGGWLALLLQALQNRLQRITQGLADATRLRRSQRLLAAARIRRIYAELMDLSEDLGKPRNPAKTPLEFLPALNELFPTLELELAKITNAYLQVRYGELPETRQEVEDVEKAWALLHAQGREQMHRKKQAKSYG
jgi:hypothetical protein